MRLLIVTVDGQGKITETLKRHAFMQLGLDVFQHGTISKASLDKLIETLIFFKRELKKEKFNELPVHVFGTSAMREALNQESVILVIQEATDWQVEILTGEQEAMINVQGLRFFLPPKMQRMNMADLGGGSLEITVLNKKIIHFQRSFPVGVLRTLHEERSKTETSLFFRKKWISPLREELLTALRPVTRFANILVLSGGTAKSIARLLSQDNPSWVRNALFECTWKQFQKGLRPWLGQNSEFFKQLPGISPQKADMIPFAIELFVMLGEVFASKQVNIPFFGLKESLTIHQMFAQYPHLLNHHLVWQNKNT